MAPGLKIEWTSAKRGKQDFNVLQMYPGDDVVDLWGVHYYDSGPIKNTQKIWDQYFNMSNNGGPFGLGTWVRAARAHGKRIGIPEWGVWDQGGGRHSTDNPVYIENMYRFFKTNASSLSYENYYNCPTVTRVHPTTHFPKASSTYQRLWASGS